MHYYFCPRCNFRMMATKPLCPTCGHKIPRPSKPTKSTAEVQGPVKKQNNPGLLSKILKWDFASPTAEKTESA